MIMGPSSCCSASFGSGPPPLPLDLWPLRSPWPPASVSAARAVHHCRLRSPPPRLFARAAPLLTTCLCCDALCRDGRFAPGAVHIPNSRSRCALPCTRTPHAHTHAHAPQSTPRFHTRAPNLDNVATPQLYSRHVHHPHHPHHPYCHAPTHTSRPSHPSRRSRPSHPSTALTRTQHPSIPLNTPQHPITPSCPSRPHATPSRPSRPSRPHTPQHPSHR